VARLLGNSAFDLECVGASPASGLESQRAGLAGSVICDYEITVMIDDRAAHDEI
jgi:hypothetical protein